MGFFMVFVHLEFLFNGKPSQVFFGKMCAENCQRNFFSFGIVTFTVVVVVVVDASVVLFVLVVGFTVVVCSFFGFFVVFGFFGGFVVLVTFLVAFVVTGLIVVVLFIKIGGV